MKNKFDRFTQQPSPVGSSQLKYPNRALPTDSYGPEERKSAVSPRSVGGMARAFMNATPAKRNGEDERTHSPIPSIEVVNAATSSKHGHTKPPRRSSSDNESNRDFSTRSSPDLPSDPSRPQDSTYAQRTTPRATALTTKRARETSSTHLHNKRVRSTSGRTAAAAARPLPDEDLRPMDDDSDPFRTPARGGTSSGRSLPQRHRVNATSGSASNAHRDVLTESMTPLSERVFYDVESSYPPSSPQSNSGSNVGSVMDDGWEGHIGAVQNVPYDSDRDPDSEYHFEEDQEEEDESVCTDEDGDADKDEEGDIGEDEEGDIDEGEGQADGPTPVWDHLNSDEEQEEAVEAMAEEGQYGKARAADMRKASRRRRLARFLDHSLNGIEGCTPAQHSTEMMEHDRVVARGNPHATGAESGHNSIMSTYSGVNILNKPRHHEEDRPGIWTEKSFTPTGEGVTRECSGAILSNEMEGCSEEGPPKHICLHVDHDSATQPQPIWDIDSWIALPSSFEDILQGWNCIRVLKQPQPIKTNIHIRTLVYRENGSQDLELPMKIPHLYLGKMGTQKGYDNTIHIFFPHIVNPKPKFVSLTEEVISVFYDSLLWPALMLRSDQQQHQATNRATSKDKARAGVFEANRTARLGHMKVSDDHIPHSNCAGLTERMNTIIAGNLPLLADFEDFYLIIGAKGIKSKFKNTVSLRDCMQKFEADISSSLNTTTLSQFYVDIGRELIAPQAPGFNGRNVDRHTPVSHVYLQRTCCLRSTADDCRRSIFTNEKGKTFSGAKQMFNHGYLRDAGSMTIETPRSTHAFESGLRYSQWYNLYKEIFDAQSIFPFGHTHLTELAKGEEGFKQVARDNNGNIQRYHGIVNAYNHGKKRCRNALVANRHMPYGVRVEHRVSWDLFQAMKTRAGRRPLPESENTAVSTPTSVWAIPTKVFFSFMAGNYDKFQRAFETSSRTSTSHIGLERTKVNWTLLKAMAHLQSVNMSRVPALSVDSRDKPAARKTPAQGNHNPVRHHLIDARRAVNRSKMEHGMGMAKTMEENGFAWFMQKRINWRTFKFHLKYSESYIAYYADSQKGKGGHQNIARDAMDAITTYGELLKTKFGEHPRAQYQLVMLIIHAVLGQYRHDVAVHLHKTSNHKLYDATLTDRGSDGITFSWEGIHEAIQGDHILVKDHGKLLAYDQKTLIRWLFGDKNEEVTNIPIKGGTRKMKRKHFLNSAFRTAYHYGRELALDSGFGVHPFELLFKRELFTEHWVVPYPDTNGVLSSTTKGELSFSRRWFHVDRTTEGFHHGEPWAGNPKKGPTRKMLSWSLNRLGRHLNGMLNERKGRVDTLRDAR